MTAPFKIVDGVPVELAGPELAEFLARQEPAPPASTELIAYAADRRWQVETGGTTFGGMPIATDRESRAIMSQSVLYLRERPAGETIRWKGPAGWVTLDLATLTAATLTAGGHVDATFRREDAVATAIASSALSSFDQIDEAFADVTAPWTP